MKCRQRVVEITSNRNKKNSNKCNHRNLTNRREPTHRYITWVVLAVGIAVSYALVSLAVALAGAVAVAVAPRTNTAGITVSSSSETNPGMARNSNNTSANANADADANVDADANRHRPVRFEAVPVPEKNYRDDVLKYIAVYADGNGNGNGDGDDGDGDMSDSGLVTMADGIRILRSSSEAWEASWSSSSLTSRDTNASSHEPPMARALTEILRVSDRVVVRYSTVKNYCMAFPCVRVVLFLCIALHRRV